MLDKMTVLLKQMRPLRILLSVAAIFLCIFATPADTPADYEGLGVLTTLILPALTPLVFLVMLLDALMNRVWLIDAKGEDIQKFRNILLVDLILATMLFIFWIPYFISIWN